MSAIAEWWNRISRGARARWLEAHHLRTVLALYTWHVLARRDQERITRAWEAELPVETRART